MGKIEEIKKKKQKKLGVDNFDDDALLYIQGALARAKDDIIGGWFIRASRVEMCQCFSEFHRGILQKEARLEEEESSSH